MDRVERRTERRKGGWMGKGESTTQNINRTEEGGEERSY